MRSAGNRLRRKGWNRLRDALNVVCMRAKCPYCGEEFGQRTKAIDAFEPLLARTRRARCHELLLNSKRETDTIDKIVEGNWFEPRYMTKLLPHLALEVLRRKGAPKTCWLVLDGEPYNPQVVPLEEGVMSVWNAEGFISCIDGRLAYVSHAFGCSYLLERKD